MLSHKVGQNPFYSGIDTVWHYTFDGNGSLVGSLPGDQPGNGAKRYTYNTAGYLVKVETHNGASYQPQAEMQYNGLGQRLFLTAHQGGQSLTTKYVLDGDALLAATANDQTTYYLPGLAEYTTAWRYYLADGQQTVRQITKAQGKVILTRRYTPWGELLEQTGSGEAAWDYLGGALDAATGLIYLGSCQAENKKSTKQDSRKSTFQE